MSVVFRADDEPVRTRVDYWQHVLGSTIGPVELPNTAAPDFHDWLQLGELGAVHVANISVGQPGLAERTARHVRQSDDGLYKIDVMSRGRGVVEQRSRQAHLRPGDLTLVDLSHPCRWGLGPGRVIAVVFPPSLLPLDRDELTRLTGVPVPGDRGLGALVSSLAGQLPRHLDACDPATGARLGTAVIDVLATALAARLDRTHKVPPTTRQRALLLRIHAFVERHLGDPTLSPRSIAAANAVSVRYLHKLFETEHTTVAHWVRRRRLERCCRDLLDPALSDRPVGAIAARWGLTDPAHFSRLFRAAYGVPPGHYRALGDRALPARRD
jgi:AraC-like DNA-binding protein